MIYLFHGENGDKARAKWRRVGESFRAKYPSGAVFHFDAEEFSAEGGQARFEELLASNDLLGGKRLVMADRLLENELALQFFTDNLSALIEAPVVFAHLETKFPSGLVKKIEKAGGKVEEFASVGSSTSHKPEFNIFALCDALGERDRRRLWVLLQEALAAGLAAEEVFWKLVWQTKMMLLMAKSGGRVLKTVKPYTANKAARFARNYQVSELEKLSGDLVALWHETKRESGPDFAVGLERLVLNI